MRTALLLLLALAAAPLAGLAASTQTVWKWVDKDGVTHYSDRSVPGATKIELSVSNRADPVSTNAASSSSSAEPAAPSGPAYRNFEIWKPQPDDVIINTGGQVTINIRVEPQLQTGHRLYLYLDGRRVDGFAENITSYELKDVPRGTHTAAAVIVDRRGTTVQTSERVPFTVRQESIANPPVGPALRPPPKPRTSGNKPLTKQPTYSQLNGARSAIDPRTNAPVVTKPKAKPNAPKPGS